MYDDLFRKVKQNRIMYGKTFNQELLKIFQQRRNKDNSSDVMKQANPKKKRPHQCLNELEDTDDEEEQGYIRYHNSASTKSSSVDDSVDDENETYIKLEPV